ncbi:MAG: hypothetical protein D6730_06740 [Bacteroidetes bacterium]|nr:MAG: hypothetical protein D6730_06740 [Bacteroidota bacterium]
MMFKINSRAMLLLLLCAALGMQAQHNRRIGDWRAYLSHRKALTSVEKNGVVYTITTGGMFSWQDAGEEIRTFSTVEGLSGINATSMHLDKATGLIFIGYADGMIDYFSDPAEISQLGDIRRNTFFTQKRIFQFDSDGEQLYVATEFGLVVYSLGTRLPVFTVTQFADNPAREAAVSVSLYNGRVWVLLENGNLLSASKEFPNLSDPFIWQTENGTDGLPPAVRMLELGSNSRALYARTDQTVYVKENGSWRIFEPFNELHDHLSVQEEAVSALRIGRSSTIFNDGQRIDRFFEGNVEHTLVVGDAFYVANAFNGLDRWQNGELRNITPDGPTNNLSIRVVAGNGEFYIAPKGYNSAFGPDGDASGIYYYSQQSGWKILNRANGGLDPQRVNTGFARGYYDRKSSTAYMGSWGMGLVKLQQGELQAFYDCENSPLSTTDGICDPTNIGKTRISGLDMDDAGNLWMTIAFGQEALAMLTPDGQWFTIPQRLFPSGAHMLDMIIDDFGAKWIINQRNGLLVYNDQQTPDVLEDDVVVSLKAPEGQGNLQNGEVNALAKDQEGFIWVGTSEGVMVFYDAFSPGQGKVVDADPAIFEGRKLLREEIINTIAVDGGDRKWIGTGNGAYLVSRQGDELIHHFTTENSPLLSNTVNHIAIDQQTGEVYFATDAGLISYLSDATEGESGCEEVLVFPNPVFTDFDGLITIRGSSEKATIKITTVSGMLVRELQSQGGTATWDGRDVYGRKVQSGIYLALIADEFGGYPCIGKFAVIRRDN